MAKKYIGYFMEGQGNKMQKSGLEQDNKAWRNYSEKEDCTGWVTFCGWTTDGYHNRHYTGKFLVSREDQVDQELTGQAQSRKICERWMTLTWEEAEVAALDRQEWRRSVAQCIHLDAG